MSQTVTNPPTARVRPRTRALDVAGGTQEGYLNVTRTRYGSEPETVVAEKIHVPMFATAPAYVGVKAKETINMGDFNSVSVEVSLSLPVLPEMSEIDRVQQMASDAAERWLEREIKRATDPNWEGKQ